MAAPAWPGSALGLFLGLLRGRSLHRAPIAPTPGMGAAGGRRRRLRGAQGAAPAGAGRGPCAGRSRRGGGSGRASRGRVPPPRSRGAASGSRWLPGRGGAGGARGRCPFSTAPPRSRLRPSGPGSAPPPGRPRPSRRGLRAGAAPPARSAVARPSRPPGPPTMPSCAPPDGPSPAARRAGRAASTAGGCGRTAGCPPVRGRCLAAAARAQYPAHPAEQQV